MKLLSKSACHPAWWQWLIFVGVLLAGYGLIPLLLKSMPSLPLFLLDLLIVNNLLSLLCCGWVALRCGFVWYLPPVAAALFLPMVFLFYNDSALIYAVFYLVFGFLGLTFGNLVYRIRASAPHE